MDGRRTVGATSVGATFKERWAAFARERRIPDDPSAVVSTTVREARRDALEFFHGGVEFNVASNRQFAELLGDAARRQPAAPHLRRNGGH